MLHTIPRRLAILSFLLFAVFMIPARMPDGTGLHDANASGEIWINQSHITTSEIAALPGYSATAGFELRQNCTIYIDQDIFMGSIYTGEYSLTIEGDASHELKLHGIASRTGGSAGDITMQSGLVRVTNYKAADADDRYTIRTIGLLRINGGTLQVDSRRNSADLTIPIHMAVSCNQFIMNGGYLNIYAQGSGSVSSSGLHVYESKPADIKGGSLDIVTDTDTGTAYGLNLGEKTSLKIYGGSHSMRATAKKGSGDNGSGYGICGYGTQLLDMQGGTLDTTGSAYGIYGIRTKISGTSVVNTKGGSNTSSCGISTDQFEASGHSTITAEGQRYAILISKKIESGGSISISPEYLHITDPVGGGIDPTGSSTGNPVIVDAAGVPAKKAVIDYDDEIKKITVTASPSAVTKGKQYTIECTAAIDGFAHTDSFKWTISGNKSANTTVSSFGTVIISADETADKIKIRAALKNNTAYYGETEITLKNPEGVPAAGTSAKDAGTLVNETASGSISEAIVNRLPVDRSLPKINSSTLSTTGNFKKKQLTLQYSKVSGAENYIIGYRLANAKNKNWRYLTAGRKTSCIIRNLKKKSLIQIRVAAYKNGRIGPWSNICYRYFINAKAAVKRSGKRITVKIKPVKGATGYQVLYGQKKAVKGSKVKTLKGKTSVTLKKLKKGRTWYIRWRPYKIYKGKKYIGILKKAKKVTVK